MLSSTTSTRTPFNSGGLSGSGSPCVARVGTVNQNVEPAPAVLVTPSSPPISATSCLEIVSPRPVPPKRRLVEPSARAKDWKIASSDSGSMPIPVSVTSKRSSVRSPAALVPVTAQPLRRDG